MENFGVIYVAFGAPYLAQALVSAISLRVTNPDVPVCIVTNVVREPPRLAWWSPEDHWIFLEKETGSAEKTMIDRIYREDFERFGYPQTL